MDNARLAVSGESRPVGAFGLGGGQRGEARFNAMQLQKRHGAYRNRRFVKQQGNKAGQVVMALASTGFAGRELSII